MGSWFSLGAYSDVRQNAKIEGMVTDLGLDGVQEVQTSILLPWHTYRMLGHCYDFDGRGEELCWVASYSYPSRRVRVSLTRQRYVLC